MGTGPIAVVRVSGRLQVTQTASKDSKRSKQYCLKLIQRAKNRIVSKGVMILEENILEEEPYFNKLQFQETKIGFLRAEVNQLQTDAMYYKETLLINKEALRIAYGLTSASIKLSVKSTEISGLQTTAQTVSARDVHLANQRAQQSILELLNKESFLLRRHLSSISEDIRLAKMKVVSGSTGL
jgi:hypothetical protein